MDLVNVVLTMIPFGTGSRALKITANGRGLSGEMFQNVSQSAVFTTPKGTRFEAILNTGLVLERDCPDLWAAIDKAGYEMGACLGGIKVSLTEIPKQTGEQVDEVGF